MRVKPSGAERGRGQWIMLTDEQQAEILASKRQWRAQIARDWKAQSAGRDSDELRREQAYRAVVDQARWHNISLSHLERDAVENHLFMQDVVHSLVKKIFFPGNRVEPGYTGLFDHCSREETENFALDALQRVIADVRSGTISDDNQASK